MDALRFLAGDLECAFLHLALGHVAQHRDHFAPAWNRNSRIERPAAHFDPGEMPAMRIRIAVAADAEFDRAVLAERGRVGERRQISRPVGDMHAIEQAVTGKLAGAHAEQWFCRR